MRKFSKNHGNFEMIARGLDLESLTKARISHGSFEKRVESCMFACRVENSVAYSSFYYEGAFSE